MRIGLELNSVLKMRTKMNSILQTEMNLLKNRRNEGGN